MSVSMSLSKGQEALDAQILARRAQFALVVARYITWIGAPTVVTLVVLWLFSRQHLQLLVSILPFVGVEATAWAYPVFYRQGRAITGIWILLVGVLALLVVDFVLLYDMQTALILGYAVLVLIGIMLLGSRGGLVLAALSVVCMMASTVVGRTVAVAWFPPFNLTLVLATNALFGVMALSVLALTSSRIVMEQEEYFRQSQQAQAEIERRAVMEREQRQRIEAIVQRYRDYMAEVAQGDLSTRLSVDEEKDVTQAPLIVLGHQLNETTASLQKMILQVQSAAARVSTATSEILAATTQQATGASQQSAAISQTTTTVDEVKTIAGQATSRIQDVASAAQRTAEVSRAGQQAVQDTIESMEQIRERVEGIAENILALSEQTQQIGQIIATVNELASQSNMLALNASVEAARAGEAGRGFAVVAAEVRSLAEQSRQATDQVRDILSEIQRATNAAVMATEEGTKGVEQGVQLATSTQEAIALLAATIDTSTQAATQVVAGGQQQQAGIDQIAQAMQSINQATIQSLNSIRQIEQAARDLNELAHELDELVGRYAKRQSM